MDYSHYDRIHLLFFRTYFIFDSHLTFLNNRQVTFFHKIKMLTSFSRHQHHITQHIKKLLNNISPAGYAAPNFLDITVIIFVISLMIII